jgi:hypothetical protein
LQNSIIEISKKTAKAGRTPIKLILHEIYTDTNSYNKNGISWNRIYTEENMDSVKGSPIVTQFIDKENSIPLGGHGEMNSVDGDVYFEDSLVVGTFENAFIAEDIEVNGKTISALIGEGYIFNQRFPHLVEYLQEQYDNNIPVEGSIEINADKSKGNKKIIYDGGYKEKGRVPQIYQYSGYALLFGEPPADDSAMMLELNSYRKKEGENKNMSDKNKNIINKGAVIEMNKLNYYDICSLITRAFNKAMGSDEYGYEYDIHRFYPIDSQVVFSKWREVGKYYSTNYTIENSTVTIGEIIQVEEDWKPVSNSQAVEINIEQIRQIITNQKGGSGQMNVEELNAKITELSGQINELNIKVTELNSSNGEKDTKITELNETLSTVNKSLEEANEKCSALEVECNGYKKEKEKVEKEKKQAEINSYFETEIPKNKFEEAEVNSLKEFVEKCDLEGLKKAEADLIVKRFKEGKLTGIETNSKKEDNLFFHTKEEKLDDIEAGKSLFV